jgi:hypothetical protein
VAVLASADVRDGSVAALGGLDYGSDLIRLAGGRNVLAEFGSWSTI